MRLALVVLGKELVDNLRDRRTLFTALGVTVLGPLLFTALLSFAIQVQVDDADTPVEIAVVGAGHAPNLIDFLASRRVTTRPGPEDPETAVAERREDVVLLIPEDYGEQFRAGRPAALRLIYDSARRSESRQTARRVEAALDDWDRIVGRLRLQARGIDPQLVSPLAVERADVASPAAQAASLLAMIPYLILFAAFMGGFYLAIDTTAGEREQGSLEPLLTQPATRTQLVLGKLGAVVVFSLLTVVAVSVATALAVARMPLAEIGMSVELGVVEGLAMAAVVAPLTLLAAALMTVVASFTQSFKEAQTWLTPVIMVPILPLVLLSVLAPEATPLTMLVPSLSQALLVNGIVAGDPLSLTLTAISATSTLVYGAALSLVAVGLYRREALLG